MVTMRQQIHITRVGKEREAGTMDTDRAPFRRVDHALKQAYRLENDTICRVSSFLADLRASELRGVAYYDSPWEKHAQAAMVLRYVHDHSRYADVIDARYRVPRTNDQVIAKWTSCVITAKRFIEPKTPLAQWCVADWAGIRLERNWLKHWAKQMNVSIRTVYRTRKRIHEELNQLESKALNELEDVMREVGLID